MSDNVTRKACTLCGWDKPLAEFYVDPKLDRLDDTCKACRDTIGTDEMKQCSACGRDRPLKAFELFNANGMRRDDCDDCREAAKCRADEDYAVWCKANADHLERWMEEREENAPWPESNCG